MNGKSSTAPGARLSLVVLLLVGVLAAGCVKPGDPGPPPLEGTSWILVNASLGVPTGGTTMTLRFKPPESQPGFGVVEATTHCYEMRGYFLTAPGGRLLLNPSASRTPVQPCQGPMVPAHDRFVAGLSAATSYRVVDGELRILQGDQVRLRFTAAPVEPPRREAVIVPSAWDLIPESLGASLPAGTTIFIDIRGAVISGSAGCNAFSGPLDTSTDGRFLVGALVTTDMACEPAVMDAERIFFARLSHIDNYRSSGRALELLRGTESVLRFTPTAGPGAGSIAGTYRILGLPDARSGAVGPLIPDSHIGLTLTPEGSLSGSACNTYGGSWLVEGDRFTVSDLWWHARACGTPEGVDGQENRYFTALKAANRWELRDGELLLYADDRPLVRAARE